MCFVTKTFAFKYSVTIVNITQNIQFKLRAVRCEIKIKLNDKIGRLSPVLKQHMSVSRSSPEAGDRLSVRSVSHVIKVT